MREFILTVYCYWCVMLKNRALAYTGLDLYVYLRNLWSRYQESNLDLLFRREPFYPLNYNELVLPTGSDPVSIHYQCIIMPLYYESSIRRGPQSCGWGKATRMLQHSLY